MSNQEKKDNIISAIVTVLVMILLLIISLFISMTSLDPPPPPKKVLLIEMSSGGGGGGNSAPQKAVAKPTPSQNLASQNAADAPSVAKPQPNTTSKPTAPVVEQPKVDQNAVYRPGKGGGAGGGSGSGSGSGKGSGIGPGEGSGSGGGIGYGNGNRGYAKIPDMTINEKGQVVVEVHVSANGDVINARILPNGTTITNSEIQKECIRRAKQTKYRPGDEELRKIVFKS